MIASCDDRPAAEDFDVDVGIGHVRVHRFGPSDGRLVVCVHGISANSRWFDYLAQNLAGPGRQVVSIDLRGRGRSAVTPRGTYGLLNHARDVFSVVRALGVSEFDYIGHSMGAYVGMEAGALTGETRIGRMVLVDGLGVPRFSALRAIGRILSRLDRTYASSAEYVAYVRNLGLMRWSAFWQRVYEYDCVEIDGRVRSRAQRSPILEDVAYGRSHDPRRLWRKLAMPVLALRATHALAGRSGYIVPAYDLHNFARIAPQATVAEIDDDHYDIVMNPNTLAAVRKFLDADA